MEIADLDESGTIDIKEWSQFIVKLNSTISNEKLGCNSFEAISIGTSQGVKLAINVGAMLLVFIAFITMTNYFLKDFIGELMNINMHLTSLDWI